MPPAPPRLRFAGGTLLLEGMAPASVKRLFQPQPWVWDPRVSAWRCDALEYLSVRRSLQKSGWTFTDAVPQWDRISLSPHASRC